MEYLVVTVEEAVVVPALRPAEAAAPAPIAPAARAVEAAVLFDGFSSSLSTTSLLSTDNRL